jgi:hypothetical protein
MGGAEDAAQRAGVLAQASREVSDTSRQAAESLAELRSAIGDISACRLTFAAAELHRCDSGAGVRAATA